MINEILEGLTSRLKNADEKGGAPTLPGQPPASADGAEDAAPDELAKLLGSNKQNKPGDDISNLLGADTEELENKVKELETKTTKLDKAIEKTLKIAEGNRDRLDKIDANMRKFLSLYEMVTNQVNPFVESPDDEPGKKRKMLMIGAEPPEEAAHAGGGGGGGVIGAGGGSGPHGMVMPGAQDFPEGELPPEALDEEAPPEGDEEEPPTIEDELGEETEEQQTEG